MQSAVLKIEARKAYRNDPTRYICLPKPLLSAATRWLHERTPNRRKRANSARIREQNSGACNLPTKIGAGKAYHNEPTQYICLPKPLLRAAAQNNYADTHQTQENEQYGVTNRQQQQRMQSANFKIGAGKAYRNEPA
jgi:hypothetical protein